MDATRARPLPFSEETSSKPPSRDCFSTRVWTIKRDQPEARKRKLAGLLRASKNEINFVLLIESLRESEKTRLLRTQTTVGQLLPPCLPVGKSSRQNHAFGYCDGDERLTQVTAFLVPTSALRS